MDNYEVIFLSKALRDLDGIYTYIAKNLSEPETALALVDELEEQILSLERMPYRCPERRVGVYAGKGYRQLLVKNYVAIFRVDEANKEVVVVTIQYAKRNI